MTVPSSERGARYEGSGGISWEVEKLVQPIEYLKVTQRGGSMGFYGHHEI